VQISIALIALATGGLGGAFFNAWWLNRSTVVTYTVTTTTIGTDQRVKSLLPDIKIQVGNQELPLIHAHTVELRPQSGPYAERAEIALVFPPGVRLLSKAVTETASPLHRVTCNDLVNGATCQIGPLLAGNGFFRVSFAATGTNDSPAVTMAAKGVQLAKAEAVLAASRADSYARIFREATISLTIAASCIVLWFVARMRSRHDEEIAMNMDFQIREQMHTIAKLRADLDKAKKDS
jgi:hypothetical protein